MAANVIPRDSLVGMVGGPIVWSIHFLVCYILTALACAFQFDTAAQGGWGIVNTVLVIVSALALAIIGGLGFLAYRRWQRAGGSEKPRDPEQARQRFMALTALLLCILSAIAVAYVAAPLLILSACQ